MAETGEPRLSDLVRSFLWKQGLSADVRRAEGFGPRHSSGTSGRETLNSEEETSMAFHVAGAALRQGCLAPHLSAETLEYHHDKHHNAYVNNLNGLDRRDRPGRQRRLEEIILGVRRRRLQQRRPGLEPHLLLELHEAGRRRRAAGRAGQAPSTATSARSTTSRRSSPRRR